MLSKKNMSLEELKKAKFEAAELMTNINFQLLLRYKAKKLSSSNKAKK